MLGIEGNLELYTIGEEPQRHSAPERSYEEVPVPGSVSETGAPVRSPLEIVALEAVSRPQAPNPFTLVTAEELAEEQAAQYQAARQDGFVSSAYMNGKRPSTKYHRGLMQGKADRMEQMLRNAFDDEGNALMTAQEAAESVGLKSASSAYKYRRELEGMTGKNLLFLSPSQRTLESYVVEPVEDITPRRRLDTGEYLTLERSESPAA